MYKRKRPSFYLLLLCFMALLTTLFFVGGPGDHSPRSFKAFWNTGHLLYYALLPVFLLSFERIRRQSGLVQFVVVIGTTLIMGVLVELLQYGVHRSPDLGDITRNFIGAGIAVCFFMPMRHEVPKGFLLFARCVLVVLVTVQLLPVVIACYDEYQARLEFPALSDFQSPRQLDRWGGGAKISIEEMDESHNKAMRADLTTEEYSGISLEYFPHNWSEYRLLQFRIYNPSTQEIQLTCRIHDRIHTEGEYLYQDRFNRSYIFPGGWTTITISLEDVRAAPATREMDLKEIYDFSLFAIRLKSPQTIYIDDVILR